MISFVYGYFFGGNSVEGWGSSILAELAIECFLCIAIVALASYIGGA